MAGAADRRDPGRPGGRSGPLAGSPRLSERSGEGRGVARLARDGDGAFPGPGQARRVRPRSDGGGAPADRGQGVCARRPADPHAGPRAAGAHYAEHEGKPFYEPLVEFMSSGPVDRGGHRGHRCIEGFRALAGATDPTAALPGRSAATSAATGASRSSRTSSTGRTARSRPPARSASGSPTCDSLTIVGNQLTPEGRTSAHDPGERPNGAALPVTPVTVVTRSATRGGWAGNPPDPARESPP